jgi:cell division protein FtsI/penicillin-binding protein 2
LLVAWLGLAALPAWAQADVAARAPRQPGVGLPAVLEPAPMVPPEVLSAPPVTRDVLVRGEMVEAAEPGSPEGNLAVWIPVPPSAPELEGPLQVEYTLDPGLTKQVFDTLDRLQARLANVVLLDAATGRVMVYASSDPEEFPPTRPYPAASLIKVVTAAAALHYARPVAEGPCRYAGNPHWLPPQRVDPPSKGRLTDLGGALAFSNNQCFAQLAVHALGTTKMVDAVRRFGFLQEPAPGHSAGVVDAGSDRYDLGKLGCGLSGCWITPMHAARMAMTLANGRQLEPYWIARVTDGGGRVLQLPPRRPPKQVLTPELASELRTMMIETTVTGTARRGFTGEGGAPVLGPVQVSGKTGTLSGKNPDGLYEWFAGVAPADDPKIAIAVVSVARNGHRVRATRIASEVLEAVFCGRHGCRPDAVDEFVDDAEGATARFELHPPDPLAGG